MVCSFDLLLITILTIKIAAKINKKIIILSIITNVWEREKSDNNKENRKSDKRKKMKIEKSDKKAKIKVARYQSSK